MVKIAFFEVKEEWEIDTIHEKYPEDDVLIYETPLQDVNPGEIQDIEAICVFIYSDCSKENLEKFPNLKFICTRSTGFNHIDREYVKEKQIILTNVPHYGMNSVAEFTLGLLLNISRKICESIKRVESGIFDFSGLRGFDLLNKTIGIIGFGNTGQKFAKFCKALEMNVIAYDIFADRLQDRAKEMGVNLVDWDSLLKSSDIISVHLALIPDTVHIINKDTFSKMKKGVVLLNTARGELIDTLALLDALDQDIIGYYAADVLEEESAIKDELELFHEADKNQSKFQVLVQDHALIDHPRTHITPHNAFNSQEALERILNTSIYNLNCFLNGIVEENIVNCD
jgi:D-lactate dehydrogenase